MSNETNVRLSLRITSSDQAMRPSAWREDCRSLYLQVRLKAGEGIVSPAESPHMADDRSGAADSFANLILTGINLGVFAGLFQLFKLWLQNRKTCELTITYPDGFKIQVSRIPMEEALKLHEEHTKRSKGNIIVP